MAWLARWRRRKRERREGQRAYKENKARLIGLTPAEMAEKVADSDLAAQVSTGDMTWLAGQIAQLTDWERYILGRAAEEGLNSEEIARQEFVSVQTANLRPILKRLRQKPAGP